MPRTGRLHIAGGYFHLLGRGMERRYIFNEDTDKQDFLSRLGDNLAKSDAQCLAWAIMSNHYHLLIRAGSKPLAKLMAPVLGGYAGAYNRRNQRCGYVFQNRYASILCDADSYLYELIRYIHLNPVRAGLVENVYQLSHYPWTGHASIMGNNTSTWQSIDEVLMRFGRTTSVARLKYCQFLGEGVSDIELEKFSGGGLIRSHDGWEDITRLRKEHIQCIGDERILGNSDFVEQILKEDELTINKSSDLYRQGWDLEKLISHVCQLCEIKRQQLMTKARANNLARAKSLICYWGTEQLGLSMKEIGVCLQITPTAVSKWVRQGRDYCERGNVKFLSY